MAICLSAAYTAGAVALDWAKTMPVPLVIGLGAE